MRERRLLKKPQSKILIKFNLCRISGKKGSVSITPSVKHLKIDKDLQKQILQEAQEIKMKKVIKLKYSIQT